jgi:predicted metal-dependent phosphoesterase TrpH
MLSTASKPLAKNYPDPHRINVDLHSHTAASDGTLSAVELVQRAAKNGVQYLAITDHDETANLAAAHAEAASQGIGFVNGVEISVSFCDTTIHIVGLGIDPTHPALAQGLQAIRDGRDGRAIAMGKALEKHGIVGAFEGALQYAGNPKLVSRTHFARHFVAQGICETTQDVFQKYLVEGKPGFVPHEWASLSQAISWIRAASGVAVIAHPGRYRLNTTQRWAMFSEFKDLGGQAVEVVTGSHTVAQYSEYAKLSVEFGFAASRGSDFHSPTESRIDVGMLPELPSICEPVWARFPQLLG